MKEKILITGASGFIGTNLLELFRDRYDVLNIDFNAPKNEAHLSYWKSVDIVNYSVLENVVLNFSPNYIVHLAARTDLEGKTLDDYKANTVGVENILKVASALSNLKKIIITSSMFIKKINTKWKNSYN